jgi:hypothetical protein
MGVVRKIAAGVLVAVVLLVGALIAVVLFIALVNVTSGGPDPDEPSYSDDGLYQDYLDQQGRQATDEEARLKCEEARQDNPDLTC